MLTCDGVHDYMNIIDAGAKSSLCWVYRVEEFQFCVLRYVSWEKERKIVMCRDTKYVS